MDIKCSFPKNQNSFKIAVRLLYQVRFLIIWIFLKLVRVLRPNKNNIYQKDVEYIEWANKVCKKSIPDDLHDSFHSYVEGVKKVPELFDSIISPGWWEENRILEVGSGLGQHAHQLAEKGAKKVIGIDYSYEKVNWSKTEFYESNSKKLSFIQGNTEYLCFADDKFDFAYSSSVLEHLKDPKKALQEIFRVVKPGGKLLLTVDYFHGPRGDHLYDYIYFPWATTLVCESSLCRYWSEKLQKDQEKGKMGFYLSGIRIENLGEGSEVQLNKLNSDHLEKIMVDVGWQIDKKVPSFYIGALPVVRFLKSLKFYLQAGCGYELKKVS